MSSATVTGALALLLITSALVGCVGVDYDVSAASTEGPSPPPGEDYTGLQPIDLIFGGSLKQPLTRVLLVPPTHGDLSSPLNESRSAEAYLEATVRGIRNWEKAIEAFADAYPEYAYLEDIEVEIEVFDGDTPSRAGYDIVIGYAETAGPVFRGVAANGGLDTQGIINWAGLGDLVHYGNRYILLSLFSSAPRAGQHVPDYPETHEVEGVTMHEFAHTWGLGHSTTWTRDLGPDLMNSPYPFVYGDGDPLGDGGERSSRLCITTLDLYGLAHLYRWLPSGEWEASHGRVSLPDHMPYERYCFGDWDPDVSLPATTASVTPVS